MSGAIILNKVAVEDKPTPRTIYIPKDSASAPIPLVVFDGSASAGSRHVVDLASGTIDADIQAEAVWCQLESGIRYITFSLAAGQGAHAHEIRIAINPGTDVTAFSRLKSGAFTLPWLTLSLDELFVSAPVDISEFWVLATIGIGSTIANVKSRLQMIGGA